MIFLEYIIDRLFFGHIDSDVWDQDIIRQSRKYYDEIPECDTCALSPTWYRLKICHNLDKEICYKEERDYKIFRIQQHMQDEYKKLIM